MTAITVNKVYDQSTTPSGQFKVVDFSGGIDGLTGTASQYTYTPGVSSGKTIRVINCRLGGGTVVKATVSNNVVTIGETDSRDANAGDLGKSIQRGTLVYTET